MARMASMSRPAMADACVRALATDVVRMVPRNTCMVPNTPTDSTVRAISASMSEKPRSPRVDPGEGQLDDPIGAPGPPSDRTTAMRGISARRVNPLRAVTLATERPDPIQSLSVARPGVHLAPVAADVDGSEIHEPAPARPRSKHRATPAGPARRGERRG